MVDYYRLRSISCWFKNSKIGICWEIIIIIIIHVLKIQGHVSWSPEDAQKNNLQKMCVPLKSTEKKTSHIFLNHVMVKCTPLTLIRQSKILYPSVFRGVTKWYATQITNKSRLFINKTFPPGFTTWEQTSDTKSDGIQADVTKSWWLKVIVSST